jgi:hypothetical protein
VALYSDVASLTDNQLDRCNLLWRSVIRYGTSKIWYWAVLMTLAVAMSEPPRGRHETAQHRKRPVRQEAPPRV